MRLLGWYSFVIIVIAILFWLPDIFSNSDEVETAIWVVVLFTPVAYYLFKKATGEK